MATLYKLYYYPIPARGEFIQLILEFVGQPYEDVRGIPDIMTAKTSPSGCVHFAHPILQVSETLSISQTPVICAFLAKKHGLMPEEEDKEYIAIQIDHNVHDVLVEVQATHHPIENRELALPEAILRASSLKNRLPKLLGHFEQSITLHSNGNGPFLFGSEMCYVDLSLAFLLEGLEYAFPTCFNESLKGDIPRLVAIQKAVQKLESWTKYAASGRKQPFSDGIFRYRRELDE